MIFIISVVTSIVLLILDVAMAINMCKVAAYKGYDSRELYIFAWCFFCGPIGYLYVIALPDLRLQNINRQIMKFLAEVPQTETSKDEEN